MQRCNVRHVKEGAFRGLGRLVFLNLANNNIEILYQVIMHLMSNIQHFFWQDPDLYSISTNVKVKNVPVPFFVFLVSRSLLMGSPRWSSSWSTTTVSKRSSLELSPSSASSTCCQSHTISSSTSPIWPFRLGWKRLPDLYSCCWNTSWSHLKPDTSCPHRACRTSNGSGLVTILWTISTLKPLLVSLLSPVSVWTTMNCSSSPQRLWPGKQSLGQSYVLWAQMLWGSQKRLLVFRAP